MQVVYHPEAEAELLEAVGFYEERLEGLGDRFLNEVDQRISEVLDAPNRWRVVEADVRRVILRRFPYGIYYRVAGEELRILAVKHHSRHPDYWKHRTSP